MTTMHQHDWLRQRLGELCSEDDFAGGLNHVSAYPEFDSRRLSEFEAGLRDWGFAYGLAFGLALSEWPDEPHELLAERALSPALAIYRRWGGDIEDPVVKRENAIRGVVRRFGEANRYQLREGHPIDGKLLDALLELDESARG